MAMLDWVEFIKTLESGFWLSEKGRNLNHATSSVHYVSIPEHVVMILRTLLVPRVAELPQASLSTE